MIVHAPPKLNIGTKFRQPSVESIISSFSRSMDKQIYPLPKKYLLLPYCGNWTVLRRRITFPMATFSDSAKPRKIALRLQCQV